MTAGQASAEYAGLLGLAAVIGAALALAAGPPLASAVRDVLVAALSGGATAPSAVAASAADIADVQSTLLVGEDALTPDAALVSLSRRHPAEEADAVASAVLLSTALAATPWLGTGHTYRAWLRRDDGPYEPPAEGSGDRDTEQPTGAPVAMWVTVGAQRRSVEAALAPHRNLVAVALDIVSLIPEGGLVRLAVRAGGGPFERAALTSVRDAVEGARKTLDAVDVVEADAGDVPAGMRAGDVVVAWPVHRTAWRAGRIDPAPRRIAPHGFGSVPLVQDYLHLVFLRPGAHGLAVIAQGLGT
jgi:hypothetical protein